MLFFIVAAMGIFHVHQLALPTVQTISSDLREAKEMPRIFLNEILFDPVPVRGLPNLEYIELFNAGGEAVDLLDWKLNGGKFPGFILMPGEFLIVCKAGHEELMRSFGNTVGINPWDVLNNEGQEVRLEDNAGVLVDNFFYSPVLITDPDKRKGGWSIEMKNPEHICKGSANWGTCVDPSGGTPGRINSIFSAMPDTDPPEILGVNWTSRDTLEIRFSEPPGQQHELDYTSFAFVPFLKVRRVVPDPQTILIVLWHQINPGELYTLRISGISDCLGNRIKDTLIQTGIGRMPQFNDLLITELMIDEKPSAGMPESEYIEIFNPGEFIMDLGGTRMLNSRDTFPLPEISLFPGKYKVFCPRTRSDLFYDIPDILGISPFPALLNDGSVLALINERNQLIFSLQYDISWYHDLEKSSGGYSLEMIDLLNPCGDSHNWRASDSPVGGTPGAANSVSAANPDLTGPTIKNVYMPGPQLLEVDLSEKLHPGSLKDLEIFLSGGEDYSISHFDSLFYDSFSLTFSNPLSSSVRHEIQVSGIRDCAGNKMKNGIVSFFLSRKSEPGDLIINEILFNPRPGGVDWIEILNRSGDYIDLSDLSFSGIADGTDGNKTMANEINRILPPSGLMVYTKDRNKLLADFPKSRPEAILEIKNMPEMPDQFGEISLTAGEREIIDQFSYSSDYHYPLIRDDEGVSLERISSTRPTNDPANWHSASSLYGYGSPTFENPNQETSGHRTVVVILDPDIISPDGDGYHDELLIHFFTGSPGYSANLDVYDVSGHRIRSILENTLLPVSGSISWNGYDQRGNIPPTGAYILRFEIYNLSGDVRLIKKRFVISKNR
jgi:hypothetical protein